MKKLTKSAAIFLFAISVLALGFGAVSTSSAQDISTENVLLQKLDALVDQLAKLATNSQDPATSTDSSATSQSISLLGLSGVKNPSCFDNYASWPTSTTRKEDASWSLKNFGLGYLSHHLVDLNGDGLIDYMDFSRSAFSLYYNGSYREATNEKSCVLLNTGMGWDPAYRCITSYNYQTDILTYYGDCAQL